MSDIKLIKQHNAITEARYEMSSLEKNILYMLMAELNEGDDTDKTYTVFVNKLSDITGKAIEHAQFKKATEKLINRVISVKQNDDSFINLNVLSSGKYLKRKGRVNLELSKEIRSFFFELKNRFTLFEFESALKLRGIHSKRIYEYLSQYKVAGRITISVLELKQRLCLYDDKTGEGKYLKWSAFQKYVLEAAKKEIEEKTDISFTYKTEQEGRKITKVKFIIKKKNMPSTSSDKSKRTTIKGATLKNDKLNQEELKCYITLQKDLRWLDKKLAYKVVKNLKISQIYDIIHKLKSYISAGENVNPINYFEYILNPQNANIPTLEKKEEEEEELKQIASSIYKIFTNNFDFGHEEAYNIVINLSEIEEALKVLDKLNQLKENKKKIGKEELLKKMF
ncbi:MAG: replication initiation protein [Bacteroidetes bacterium]|nr:replication initiation protein [Bacteroidota bacterium]